MFEFPKAPKPANPGQCSCGAYFLSTHPYTWTETTEHGETTHRRPPHPCGEPPTHSALTEAYAYCKCQVYKIRGATGLTLAKDGSLHALTQCWKDPELLTATGLHKLTLNVPKFEPVKQLYTSPLEEEAKKA